LMEGEGVGWMRIFILFLGARAEMDEINHE
jgi:hypothetical protein